MRELRCMANMGEAPVGQVQVPDQTQGLHKCSSCCMRVRLRQHHDVPLSACVANQALPCAGRVARSDPLQAASSRRITCGPRPAGRGGLSHHHQVRHPAQDQGWEVLGGRAVKKVALTCLTGLYPIASDAQAVRCWWKHCADGSSSPLPFLGQHYTSRFKLSK